MPLELDARRLLPPGVHDATPTEVAECFGRFQRSERRVTLFRRLSDYVAELQRAGIECELLIDGSFVMAGVDEPEDIDLVLVLPESWEFEAALKPYLYNLVSKRMVRKTYRFDVFAVRRGRTRSGPGSSSSPG